MATFLECALLADNVYMPTAENLPRGYIEIQIQGARHLGRKFFARTYKKGDEVIIAIRGSQEWEDWVIADGDIAFKNMPIDQVGDAFDYFIAVKSQFSPETSSQDSPRFLLVGHSLGGGLAALVASRVSTAKVKGITFNAPGLGSFKTISYASVTEQDLVTFHGLTGALTGASEGISSGTLTGVIKGALKGAATEIIKQTYGKTAGALEIPKPNSRNVINLRTSLDPVSKWGHHIGNHPPFTIGSALPTAVNTHGMGEVLAQLKNDTRCNQRV